MIPKTNQEKARMIAECIRTLTNRYDEQTGPYMTAGTVASAMVTVGQDDPDDVGMENQLQTFHLFVVTLERELIKCMKDENVEPLI